MEPEPPPLTSRRALLSWTLRTLRTYGITPRKRLSQSFLVEPIAVRELVEWGGTHKPGTLVEIGPGLGTLTYHLASIARRIIAIEIDERLARVARDVTRRLGNVEIVVADAMEAALRGEIIVSSLPYHVAGPLTARILRENDIRAAALVLQAEVAEKLAARPGSRNYGRISALTQFMARVEPGRRYSPTCFYPPPRVASATVFLYRVRKYDAVAETYEDVIRCLFTQRNKKARRIIEKCAGLDAPWIPVEARVRDLDPRSIEELALALLRRRRASGE
jgi:16S rRNA (adenine1518-N6/adenine1519-N6)-dimethyltransferase